MPPNQDPKIETLLATQTTTQVSTLKASYRSADSRSLPGLVSIVSPFTEKVGEISNERSTLHLRVELIEMLRISQRAVDYATKAYESGRYEYAKHARFGSDRLDYLSRKLLTATSKFREAQKLDGTKLAFNESVCKIAMALFFTCQHAYDLALRAAEFSACGVHKPSKDLVTMGMRVNSAMRLCVVALMKKRVEPAEQALHQIDNWQCDRDQINWPRGPFAPPISARASCEQSIAISLLKIMDNMHSIALASTDVLVRNL